MATRWLLGFVLGIGLMLPPPELRAGDVTANALMMARPSLTHERLARLDDRKLRLKSKSALVLDRFGNTVYSKGDDAPMPIASITKLMTAVVVLESKLRLDEKIDITKADRDLIRLTGSRLRVGARLTRRELLTLALMSSENRAALALSRAYPGGTPAFVAAMNAKATELGMRDSRFVDAAGLGAGNVASVRDLARLVDHAFRHGFIRKATTRRSLEVKPWKKRGKLRYVNTNRLLRNKNWQIGLSKTGYINEAGRCLVMRASIGKQPVVIVLLNSFGKLTPFGDANRIRKWIEQGFERQDRLAAKGS